MYIVNLFHLSVIAAHCFNICSGGRTISNKTDLPISEEITIESPGYPRKNYETDTIYTWKVTAPELTEEISIRIDLDVYQARGFECDDYLKIEEIKNNNFALFKQCGKLTTTRIARGNKLKITLFSDNDGLTAPGFQLRLNVSKISTTTALTTTSAKTSLPESKTLLPVSKTTMKAKTKTKTTTKTKATMKAKTKTTAATTTTTKTTQNLFPQTTKARISTLILNFRHTISRGKPELLSTKQNAETSTKTTTVSKGFILNQKMVILIAAVGVVEVTLIIVGIIAFRRRRQQRNSPMTRRTIETHDHRPVSRKTVCSIANVYDTIPFDDEDEACDENPYKDPSEGVYDTTSKRRSHVNHNKSNYSRGSYFSHLFRHSNIYGKRKIEENLPMFSTFRGSKKETKVLRSFETPD